MTAPGGSRLSLVGAGARANDDLLRAAREMAGTRYELIGELGRIDKEMAAFLARNRELDALVAIVVSRMGGALLERGSTTASAHAELGEAVPCSEVECPVCSVQLTTWARLCGNCWSDVSGIAAEPPSDSGTADLLAEAHRVARGSYTIIGHLTRADGGGPVYFGRSVASGCVSAFRLIDRRDSSGGSARTLSQIRELAQVTPSEEKSPRAAPTGAMRPTPRAAVRVGMPEAVFALPARFRDWRAALTKRHLAIGGAVAGAALLAVLLLMRDPRPAPPASSSPGDSAVSAVPTAPTDAMADSAEVLIGGILPDGSRVSLNGIALSSRRLVLAPGLYLLVVTAPGHVTLEHRLSVEAGDKLIWTPRLEQDTTAAPEPRQSARPRTTRSTSPSRTAATETRATGRRPTCASLYGAERWEAAAQQCAREAEQGSADAQLRVGLLYLEGRAAPQNDRLAADWLHRAASKGNPRAQYELGLLTESGRGVQRSTSEAVVWFEKAAAQGISDAMLRTGRAYERGSGVRQDRVVAARWYRAAIDKGSVPAHAHLGMMLLEKGAMRDTVQGIVYVRAAAQRGDVEAQANLGMLLASGRGVARNESEAALWLKRAADAGNRDAAKALRDLERKKK